MNHPTRPLAALTLPRGPDEQADPHDGGVLHGAVPGAAAQRHLPAVLPGRRPQRPQRQPPGHATRSSPAKRGAILVGGNPVAESVPVDDQFEYQRRYPAAVQVRPPDRLLLLHLRRHRGGVEPEPDPLRQRPAALRQPGRRHGQQHPARGRLGLADDRPARRRPRRSTASRRSAPTPRPRWSRSSRRPGKILAMVSNPTYDPNLLASHDLEQRAGELRAARSRTPGKPLFNRAIQEVYPPGSTFKLVTAAAALESGDYDADTEGPRAASSSTCRRPTARCPTSGGGNCGGEQDHADPGADGLLQRRRSAALGLELGADALAEQAEKFGFGQRYLEGLGGQAVSVFPGDPDEPQTAYSRDRPVRRARHPAADGAGHRDHRQQRAGDARPTSSTRCAPPT